MNHIKRRLKKIFSIISESYHLITSYPEMVNQGVDYDTYWHDKRKNQMGRITEFQKKRSNWVLDRLQQDAEVLDLGCGDGGVLLYLRQHKQLRLIGVDVSDYALAYLQSKGVKTIKADLSQLSDIQSLPIVDYIILFETLEHLPNPEEILLALTSKARKSIFFSIPNTGYFPYRIRLLFGSFVMQWRLHPGEHLRFWTYRDLKWWLKQLGWEKKSSVHIYEGVPILNKLWGSLFGMAFVGEIICE